jgi:signal transduction histidine kinase
VLLRVPLLVLTLSILTAHAPLDLSSAHGTAVLSLTGATLWEAQKRTFGAVAMIVLVESALILALVRVGNRRRAVQRLLETRLRFERRLSNLLVSVATSPPERFDDTLEAALRLIGEDIGAGGVWLWENGEDGDDWESPVLRAGQQAEFTSTAQLPRAIRARIVETPDLPVSCLAVPLGAAGVVSGALFWVSYGAVARWSAHADKLRVVGAVVAAVIQGKRAEAALESSDRLKGAILDSLTAEVAVLDREGFIIGVNDAWAETEHAGGLPAGRSIEPGNNYLDACAAASRNGVSGAAEALLMLRLACRGERSGRRIEYASEVAGQRQWFLMRVEPLRRADGGAVVTHSDITQRKLNEIALRESENRFRSAEQMLRGLNRRLLVAQEDERRRIARELHDHLNQQIALLAIELQQLSLDPPASAEDISTAMHEQWRRTTEIASDVHAISHRLHPSKLETLGLVATVRAHCRDLSRKSLTTHFTEHGMPTGIPPETSLCLFRVAEEALSNVARHSGASEALVTLFGTGSDVVLRVVDMGSGFDDGAGHRAGGLGLVSMRERVEALGGTLSITSVAGKGTVVEARVACPALPARLAGGLAGRRAESA